MSRAVLKRDDFYAAVKAGNAPADAQLRKQFVVESITKDESAGASDRTRRFVISTASVDRDNDTIDVAGWKLDNYRKNPVVLWAHDYHSLPIARATSTFVEGDRLVATAEFADHDFANTVLRLIDGGFLRATSVGFRPKTFQINEDRRGLDFTEQELLEFSVVPVPANPEALIEARSAGVDVSQILGWAEGVVKSLGAEKKSKRTKGGMLVPAASKCATCDAEIAGPMVIELTEDGAQTRCLACATKTSGSGMSMEELAASVADAVKAQLATPCPTCAAETGEAKAGRVLSRANEGLLRTAKDHIASVLESSARQDDPPEPDPGDDPEEDDAKGKGKQTCCAQGCDVETGSMCKGEGCEHAACPDHTKDGMCPHCAAKAAASDTLELADDDPGDVVLELSDDTAADGLNITPDDIKAAITEAVKAELGTTVKQTIELTLRRLRGRVD